MRARAFAIAAGATAALAGACVALVLAAALDPATSNAQAFVPTAVVALAVLSGAFAVGLLVRRLDLRLHRAFPWLIAAISFSFTLVPFALLSSGRPESAALLYRALRIPQGIERFWDLALVLRSIDCASWGFDVFVDNNGCLQDAAIYGPGMLWLQFIPIFTAGAVIWLGVGLAAAASLGLAWLARGSSGTGQIVLLIAAIGTPWLLLLERGNVDALVILAAIIGVALVRRWPTSLWSWAVAAVLAWLMGTWKYYPFAMGLLLVPVLRLRRGWIVLGGYAAASVGYVALTWSNFRFSADSNSGMAEVGDIVVLGRIPVVARFVGSEHPAVSLQWGDVLIALLALSACAWGALLARDLNRPRLAPSMLALAGSPIYLASVLVAGFGWGYKTAFLLLCVPLLAFVRYPSRSVMAGSAVALVLVAVASSVAANALLATLAGVIAASFSLGLAGGSVVHDLVRRRVFG